MSGRWNQARSWSWTRTASIPISLSHRAPPVLHLRVHLFRPAGQPDLRPKRLPGAQTPGRGPGPGASAFRRPGHALPRFRHVRGPGLRGASGLPFELGVIRNHYVGRTFIQPSQTMRDFSVKVKLNPVREILKGKTRNRGGRLHHPGHHHPLPGQALREAGAKEVSLLVSCPPTRFPLLLRYRLLPQRRTHRLPARNQPDPGLPGPGLPGLSEPGRHGGRHPDGHDSFCSPASPGTTP